MRRYPAILSEARLHQVRNGNRWDGERELLARCRKLDSVILYRNFPKPMLMVFMRVQKYMYEQFNIVHLQNWVQNQNKGRRKKRACPAQTTQHKKLKA